MFQSQAPPYMAEALLYHTLSHPSRAPLQSQGEPQCSQVPSLYAAAVASVAVAVAAAAGSGAALTMFVTVEEHASSHLMKNSSSILLIYI